MSSYSSFITTGRLFSMSKLFFIEGQQTHLNIFRPIRIEGVVLDTSLLTAQFHFLILFSNFTF